MLGISVSDPGVFWTFVGAVVGAAALVVAVYFGIKSIKNSPRSATNKITQHQKIDNSSKGYQAGGDINVEKNNRR